MSNDARTLGRIVEEHAVPLETLENNEVIEVPEKDDREFQSVEIVELFVLIALGLEAVFPRRSEDVARLAAIARDAAFMAQLFKRNPPIVVGEDARERGRAALNGFHL